MTTDSLTAAGRSLLTGELDALAVTTLRFLAVDAVQAANSGHPGLPLGAAPAVWTLWSRHLRHDPAHPDWPDRDRFVLSAGHGSALLYALLHVFGYGLDTAELARFRQLGSRTPGHPELGQTPGVETTTGPLGQGLASAVGMALAERMLAARCNDEQHRIVDHRTWVLAGDGDLMEGISHEAASLAGRLGLGRLVVLFDDNNITIDGAADISCADDATARFAAYGWRTLSVEDGNDIGAIDRALSVARSDDSAPTFIRLRTTIGYGAPGVEGTSKAHGNPLGAEAIAAMRTRCGWPSTPFHVPGEVASVAAALAAEGATARAGWMRGYAEWTADHPKLAIDHRLDQVPAPPETDSPSILDSLPQNPIATRQASGIALTHLASRYPALVGGSADLAASTNTGIPGGSVSADDFSGRTIHFGIREHAMAAVMNGIAVHGGLRPFGSTFLVFADYLRPALRLSALMRQPVIYVFTHDSVHVGEDGPTHQPIEHIESLRLIPGVTVLRPADAAETALAWDIAAHNVTGPTALILTRQSLPNLGGHGLEGLRLNGFRTVGSVPERPDVLLGASGSEVSLALSAAELLAERGVRAAVISVMWRERLGAVLSEQRAALPDVPAVWIEAGVTVGWRALARDRDDVVGLNRFGESGPGPQVASHLGLTPAAIVESALETLARSDRQG
jgi:transketolase